MKKICVIIFSSSLLIACSKAKSGKQLGEDVCDCSKKANAMPASDPQRPMRQADCMEKQQAAWTKVKDDPTKADEFNAVLSKCASEQIKSSFGQ
jgi:hypothetical protein